MKNCVTVQSPAKINISLSVGKKRRDGFHSILSIFQAVSLHDTVIVDIVGQGGDVKLDANCSCAMEQNTAYKAAKAFLGELNVRPLPSVNITIQKSIPEGSGLGGGSSNAAATFKAMQKLWPNMVAKAKIMEMAKKIGSDVPFFLHSPCALVRSRGEKIQALSPRLDFVAVILKPEGSVSTKKAYDLLDDERAKNKAAISRLDFLTKYKLIKNYKHLPPAKWPFFNDFTPIAESFVPDVKLCIDLLNKTNAVFTSLSGSGSAVFGIFESEIAANASISSISDKFKPILCFPLASFE